jgi:hypothetical protein
MTATTRRRIATLARRTASSLHDGVSAAPGLVVTTPGLRANVASSLWRWQVP